MKLTIENFRCHKHKIINLPDRGLVMLAGPNGCGKSTIMNAFAYVVYGKIKKPYSRDSTKTCKVTLEFDEGIKIVRTSRPNVLKVEYQNQLYEDDAGQSIIDKHILGLNEMEFSVSSYIVQKKECSILNMTPAAQAKIIENLALSDDRHEKLKAATKTLIKERETQITALRSNLDYLIPELEQKRIAMGDVPQNAEPPPRSRASVMEEYKHFVLEKRRLEGEIEEYRSRLAKEQRKERQHGVAKQTISKCEGELQMLTERLLEEFSEYNPESDTWCLSFDAPEGFDSTCISRHALIKEMDLASKKRHLFKTLKELDQSEENLNLLEENHKAQILEKICNLTRHPDFLSDEAIDKQKSQVNKAKTKDIIYRKYLDRLGRVQEAKSALKELCSEISSALSKEIEEVELESTIKSLLPHLCCPECKTKLVLPPNGELEKVKTCKGALKEDVNAKEWLEQYTSLILFTTEELNEIPNPDYQNKKERLERALKIKEQIETLKESLEDVDFIVFRRKTLERDRRVLKEELKELNFDYDPEEFLEYTRAALNQISNKEAAYKELVAKKESKAQKLEELEATIEGFDPKRMLKLETAISKAFLKVQEITTKLEILEEEKERVVLYEEYECRSNEVKKMQSTIDEKRAALTVAERELCGGSGLLDVIKKAVFVSIEQTLESINSHARFHLEAMHPDDYIDVRLNNIATTQKGANKLQISVSINHKGGAGTLDELSGGEGQKCELAFILAVNDLLASKILMLDETVVYLDADVTQSILDYLKTQAENKLILVVSHTLVTGVFDEIIEV